MEMESIIENFRKLHEKVRDHELMKRAAPTHNRELTKMMDVQKQGLRPIATLDGVENGIILSKTVLEQNVNEDEDDMPARLAEKPLQSITPYKRTEKRPSPYIKITLTMSDEILFYEQRSMTELRDTEEGRLVAQDNERYEYLLSGKDKARRTTSTESQTPSILQKSRVVNTETQKTDHVGSYVSNFDMYDTYKYLEKSTESVEVGGQQKMNVTTYTVRGVDKFIAINQSTEFNQALMITMRILSGNVYEQQQRRFRNMHAPDPLAVEVRYLYRLNLLWRNSAPATLQASVRTVTDISWCPGDGDIYAVAYGFLAIEETSVPNQGCVCVWNIKNPVNPERCYFYEMPVVSVEFSPFAPNLLAIGLYDGIIEVRDISSSHHVPEKLPPLAISQRNHCNSEPIVAIRWVPHSSSECASGDAQSTKIEPFLALSRDGVVIKYRVINSPTLISFQQIRLERVEGTPEGLPIFRPFGPLQAGRPQGLNLCLDPVYNDIYYVLTDEGCIHKCSTNYPQQHLEVRQVCSYVACNDMHFSPWSPKLYLICGNDWNVRIWMTGISTPLITLQHGIGPIYNACWSKTHSTVIVTIGHKTINVWDISRRTLKPMSSTNIDDSPFTLFKFSNCGSSLAAGNQQGDILLLALEDMPFQPHFQYEKLESAVMKAISSDIELTNAVKSLGYFGYKKHSSKVSSTKKKRKG